MKSHKYNMVFKSLDPKCPINKSQLRIGTKIEMEHTNHLRIAKIIASQHLCESPKYYKELLKMERKLKI